MSRLHLELDDDSTIYLERLSELRRERFAPRAVDYDKRAQFPAENFSDLHEENMLQVAIPAEYGGRDFRIGNRLVVETMAVEELCKGCSSTGQGFHNHNSAIEMIDKLGSNEQKQFLYKELLDNGFIMGGWASERGGKNIADLSTRATRVTGGYRVSGQKFFSTNSGGARWGILFVEADGGGIENFQLLLVPMDAPGVSRAGDWDPLGQRATTSGTTRYEDVFVPDDLVLGKPGEYFEKCPLVGHYFQLGWAAVYVGLAGGALESGLQYIKTTSRPWFESGCERAIDDPYVQQHVADMSTRVEAARLMLYRAASMIDAASGNLTLRPAAATAVYQAKVMGTEVALEVSSDIFQLCGARAAADAPINGLDMYWRNARTFTLHDPVDYRRQRIGKFVLGVEDPPVGWY